jgi:predicted esterase YcpF (UPF0227 family)
MKIIYIPGFGGNQNSETFKKISLKYTETIFINYDNKNAGNAYIQIEKQIKNKIPNDFLIIGQSLGGFWAEYFALKYGFKLILINPSLKPFESLKKYDLTLEELKSYRKFITQEQIKSEIAIILSKNDTIVNPKPVIEKYKDLVEIQYIEGDHKLTEFEKIFAEIEKMEN